MSFESILSQQPDQTALHHGASHHAALFVGSLLSKKKKGQKSGAAVLPKGAGKAAKKDPYDIGLGVLMNQLFVSCANLYQTMTSQSLAAMNNQLQTLSNQETIISDEMNDPANKNDQNKLIALRAQQSKVNNEITQVNSSLNSMAAAATTMGNVMGKVVDALRAMLSGTTQNMASN